MGLATDRTAAENPYSAPGLNLYAGNGLDYALPDPSGAGLGAPGASRKAVVHAGAQFVNLVRGCPNRNTPTHPWRPVPPVFEPITHD